jgi:microcystin synthetase protein McyJ
MILNTVKTLGNVARRSVFLRSNPQDYYEFLGDDVVEGKGKTPEARDAKPLWLNLGYWEKARTYPEACQALAQILGDAAELNPEDRQLDVGFGFAEQDMYWVQQYNVGHITGLNITPMQVQRARQRVRARGLDHRISLGVGSATETPFADESFTKVTALECAFHFQTREQFFHEAFRVLRPGGRLAIADGAAPEGRTSPTLRARMFLWHLATPLVNYYDIDEYKRKLTACGFVNIQCRPIEHEIFPQHHAYTLLRLAGRSVEDAVVPELTHEYKQQTIVSWGKYGFSRYVIITADKPSRQSRNP